MANSVLDVYAIYYDVINVVLFSQVKLPKRVELGRDACTVVLTLAVQLQIRLNDSNINIT